MKGLRHGRWRRRLQRDGAFGKQANEQEEFSRDKIRNVLNELKLSERHITEASQANGSDVAATETSQCIDNYVRHTLRRLHFATGGGAFGMLRLTLNLKLYNNYI